MSEIRDGEGVAYRFLESDVERTIPAGRMMAAHCQAPEVEIVNDGCHRLVFVNGHAIGQVLKIDTPRELQGLTGVVELRFIADRITERKVNCEEFVALKSGELKL